MEKQIITVTKEEAANRELDHAIRMFFRREDYLCIHLIASAAQRIFIDLCNIKGVKPSIIHLIEMFRVGDQQKEIFKELFHSYNFLKHAESDHDKTLQFSVEHIEATLIDTCNMRLSLFGSHSKSSLIFNTWFCLKYMGSMEQHSSFQISKQILKLDVTHEDFNMFLMALDAP
jgi:hypothetical protein